MSTDMQVQQVTPQQMHPKAAAEMAARPDERTNTTLIEVQDQVQLSPEGRALLARMEEAGQADA